MPLTPDDIIGRRMELLGRQQLIRIGGSVPRKLFTTGNIDFPSGGNRIYVAFLILEPSNDLPVAAGIDAFAGAAGLLTDWVEPVAIGAAPWDVVGALPIILYPRMNSTQAQLPLGTRVLAPVYGRGIDFVFTTSGVPQIPTLTVSAYGWSEN